MPHSATVIALAAALEAGDLRGATRCIAGLESALPAMSAAERGQAAMLEARYLALVVQQPAKRAA